MCCKRTFRIFVSLRTVCMFCHCLVLLWSILQSSQCNSCNTIDMTCRNYSQTSQTMSDNRHNLSAQCINLSSQVFQFFVCNKAAFQFFFQVVDFSLNCLQRSQLLNLLFQFFLQSSQICLGYSAFCRISLVQSFLSFVLGLVCGTFGFIYSRLQRSNFCIQVIK